MSGCRAHCPMKSFKWLLFLRLFGPFGTEILSKIIGKNITYQQRCKRGILVLRAGTTITLHVLFNPKTCLCCTQFRSLFYKDAITAILLHFAKSVRPIIAGKQGFWRPVLLFFSMLRMERHLRVQELKEAYTCGTGLYPRTRELDTVCVRAHFSRHGWSRIRLHTPTSELRKE